MSSMSVTNNSNKETYSGSEKANGTSIFRNEKEICDSIVNEDNEEETDLTNLTWLTELRNQNLGFTSTLSLPVEDQNKLCSHKNKNVWVQNSSHNFRTKQTKANKSNVSFNKNINQQTSTPVKRATPAERYNIFVDKIKRDLLEYKQSAISYQTDFAEKPPFNYSHIIGMAMLENGRVTLQQICTWIEEKFAFFRIRKKWNNSIRHNLSLHYCFRKIDRNKFEKGKGGYWELGVDPKKCERKRIRNRRTNKPKFENTGTIPNNSKKTLRTPVSEENLEMPAVENPTSITNVGENLPLECSVNHPSVSSADVFTQLVAENSNKCQQFHLGTIIINAAEANISPTSFNLLGDNYDWPLHQHNFNMPDNITTQPPENITMPSSTDPVDSSRISLKATCNLQNQNIKQLNVLPGSSPLRPNVIVEHVIQPTVNTYCETGNILSLQTAATTTSTENSSNFANTMNDNFRPYIDGIEEAFQYLRSIDQNNREDILDNILDISVSDY